MATLIINGPCSSFDSSVFSRILMKNVKSTRVNFGINKTECDLVDVGLHLSRTDTFDNEYIRTLFSQRWNQVVVVANSLAQLEELLWSLLLFKTYNIDSCSLVFVCLAKENDDWVKLRSFGFDKICLFDEQVLDFSGLKDFSLPSMFIEDEKLRKQKFDEELKAWDLLLDQQKKRTEKPVYVLPKMSHPGMVQLIAHLSDQIFDREFGLFREKSSFMFPPALTRFFRDFESLQGFSKYYISEFQMNNFDSDVGKRISFPTGNKVVICATTNKLEDFKFRGIVLKKSVFRQPEENGEQFYFVKAIHSNDMNQQTRQEARFLLSCLNGMSNNSFEVVILIAIYYAKALISKNDLVSSFYRRLLTTMLENVSISFRFTDKMVENALKREADIADKIDENLLESTRDWLEKLILQKDNLPTKKLKTPFKLKPFQFIQLDARAESAPLVPFKQIDLAAYECKNKTYFELTDANWPRSQNLDISACTNVKVLSSMPNIVLYENAAEFKEALKADNPYLAWFKQYSKFYLVGGALISKMVGTKVKDYDLFSYYSQEETLRILREFLEHLKAEKIRYKAKLYGQIFHFFQIEITPPKTSSASETIVIEVLTGIDLTSVPESEAWYTMLPNQMRYNPARDAVEINQFTLYAFQTGCFPVDLNSLPSLPRMAKCCRDNGFTVLFPKADIQLEKQPKTQQDMFLALKKLLSVLIWNWGASNRKFKWFFLDAKRGLALKPGVLSGVNSFLDLNGDLTTAGDQDDESLTSESSEESDDSGESSEDSESSDSEDDRGSEDSPVKKSYVGSSFGERQVKRTRPGKNALRRRQVVGPSELVVVKKDKFYVGDVRLVSSQMSSEEAVRIITESKEMIKLLKLKCISRPFDTYPFVKWLLSMRDGHLGGFSS